MSDENLPFDSAKLDKLAEVAIQVGLNLQEGQELILTGPVEALPLARRIAAEAYKAGATDVTTFLSDEALTLAKYEHGSDASFDKAPNWLFNGMAEAFDDNAARMAISASNPMLLSGQDPAKVARAGKANSKAAKPAMERVTGFNVNWNIVSYPGKAWAMQVFPDLPADEAVAALAEAIFAASRVDCDDPVENWASHDATLHERQDWMNAQNFDALHFSGPGTDLTVGLADGHRWVGGSSVAKNGVSCIANMPTEEIFTTPHSQRVNGTARASKPLVHQGTLISDIEVRFEQGKIVQATASEGEEVFRELIASDEGASRLGEVALVPHSSPISQSDILFFNTLYDENAACHIAQGQCYEECMSEEMQNDKAAIRSAGGNESIIHVDWMIGGPEMDIDGVRKDGSRVPLFRKGEWV